MARTPWMGLAVLLLVPACTAPPAKPEAPERWQTLTGDAQAATVDAWIDATTARSTARVAALYADDAVASLGGTGILFSGPQEIVHYLHGGAWEVEGPRAIERKLVLIRGRELLAVLFSRMAPEDEEGWFWALVLEVDGEGRIVREAHYADPGQGLTHRRPTSPAAGPEWLDGRIALSHQSEREARNLEAVSRFRSAGVDPRDVHPMATAGSREGGGGGWAAEDWVVMIGPELEIFHVGTSGIEEIWTFAHGQVMGLHLGEIHVSAPETAPGG